MTDYETTNVEAAVYLARLLGHGYEQEDLPAPYEVDEPDRRGEFARFAPVRYGWRMMDGSIRQP